MNYAEMIKKLQEQRKELLSKMEGIHAKAGEENRTFHEAEQKAFDECSTQIESIDKQIVSTMSMQKLMGESAQSAVAVGQGSGEADPMNVNKSQGQGNGGQAQLPQGQGQGAAQGLRIGNVKSNLPKGTVFTRFAMAMAASKGNLHQASEVAKNLWGNETPEVARILKAAVAAGTTTDVNWARPLAEYRDAAGEFIELLRPETIIGRLPGFRRVPFNIRIPRQTAGAAVNWVGQGLAKPVGRLSFDSITVPFTKIAGIVVITQELARFSQPSAEALVRTDMIAAISQFMDQQFIDPAVAGTANVAPASVTNGVTPIASTGATVDSITADTSAAMMQLANALVPMQNWAWVMHPRTALYLSTLRTAQDVAAFPGMEGAAPRFRGLPVITSLGVPAADPDAGGPDGVETMIALVATSEILLADDGEVLLDVSTEAAVAMDDAGAGTLTSLWQNNLIGIRAERFVHWLKRRPGAVAVITGVTY